MENNIKNPCEIIRFDRRTGKIEPPGLLLMTRSFRIIGKIPRYENWNLSLVANGPDEISFEVRKYADGKPCPVWDDLVDLKILDAEGFGRFEISADYADGERTVKFVHGVSLETELAQAMLHEFHVNDEEAIDMEKTDYNKDQFDPEGNFLPTVLYDEKAPGRSLLHRVLACAPHWGVGYVTPYVAMDEESRPQASYEFQRTYTADGESVYDFLTGTVAEESNVVFLFDTVNRKISCHSLCDCVDPDTGEVMTDGEGRPAKGIGEDTRVLVSKNRLANEISVSSRKDEVKNCFRVEGGDDAISDFVRAANMSGSNLIYQFAPFQLRDMSERLRGKLDEYQDMMSSPETKALYYGSGSMEAFLQGSLCLKVESESEACRILALCRNENVALAGVRTSSLLERPPRKYWRVAASEASRELKAETESRLPEMRASEALGSMGIFPRLCSAFDEQAWYESGMSPNTEMATVPGTAEEQHRNVADGMKNVSVAVSSLDNYDESRFFGITNLVKEYAQIFLDSRFELEVVEGTASCSFAKRTIGGKEVAVSGTWKGKIRIKQRSDEKNAYPADCGAVPFLTVPVNNDAESFARQKLDKALSKGSMLDEDASVSRIWSDASLNNTEKIRKIRDYFDQFSLNRLTSFRDGYANCTSTLAQTGLVTTKEPATSDLAEEAKTNRLLEKQADGSYIRHVPLYDQYEKMREIAEEARQKREDEVQKIKDKIKAVQNEQELFQKGDGTAARPARDFETFLGKDAYLEFLKYRREDTYRNANYVSDGLSDSECLAKARELLEAAAKEAAKACALQRSVSVSLNNLFALPEFESFYEKFALFNYIRVRTEDEVLKLRLIGIEFGGESAAEIQVTFSEQVESVDGAMEDMKSIVRQAGSMAASYPSTIRQAKQGSHAKDEIDSLYQDGINAAKTMLANNDNNEVTITDHSGILCRQTDDDGSYNGKQLKITGNIMAFTDDGWKSVRTAFGEIPLRIPGAEDGKTAYGIVAENIVGKLIAGERMQIGNKDGSVQIDGEGITITNGLIRSHDYNESDKTGSMIDLKSGAFSFAGGQLEYDSDNGLTVTGKITATELTATKSGQIANFYISENALFTSNDNNDDADIIYLGEEGFRIGDIFLARKNNDTKGFYLEKISANSSIVGAWKTDASALSSLNSQNIGIKLDHSSQSVTLQNGMQKTVLSPKSIQLYDASKLMCKIFPSQFVNNTNTGTKIQCENDSKFLSLGRSSSPTEPDIIINNGLNPYGNKHPVQIYSETYFDQNVFFSEKASLYGMDDTIICDNYFQVDNDLHVLGFADFFEDVVIYGNLDILKHITAQSELQLNSEYGKITLSRANNEDKTPSFRPISSKDETYNGKILLGTSGNRWKEIWCAQNGINSSSDRNLKNSIQSMSGQDKLERFFLSLKPCTFRFNDGESGRTHFGFIAQDVEQALLENGMTALDFAGFCKNRKEEHESDTGSEKTSAKDSAENKGQEYEYSLRYGEFTALNTHMIQHAVRQTQKLKCENDDLKKDIARLNQDNADLKKRMEKLEKLLS